MEHEFNKYPLYSLQRNSPIASFSEPDWQPSSTNILLIDDEEDILFTFKEGLTSEGYNVEAFVDPTEAFTNFVNVNPSHYNLAILDIRMLGLNGLQLYYRLKAINRNIKILFVSALGHDGKLNYANRYAARSLSFDIIEIKDSFNKTKIFSDFVKLVNSQSTYNQGRKIKVVPLLIFHNVALITNRPDYTNAELFDQLMKYLYENHFKVLPYKQLGCNTETNTFYLNGMS